MLNKKSDTGRRDNFKVKKVPIMLLESSILSNILIKAPFI